jgi:hypothetical protein
MLRPWRGSQQDSVATWTGAALPCRSAAGAVAGGCSSRPLPDWERPTCPRGSKTSLPIFCLGIVEPRAPHLEGQGNTRKGGALSAPARRRARTPADTCVLRPAPRAPRHSPAARRLQLFSHGAELFCDDDPTHTTLQRHLLRTTAADCVDALLRYLAADLASAEEEGEPAGAEGGAAPGGAGALAPAERAAIVKQLGPDLKPAVSAALEKLAGASLEVGREGRACCWAWEIRPSFFTFLDARAPGLAAALLNAWERLWVQGAGWAGWGCSRHGVGRMGNEGVEQPWGQPCPEATLRWPNVKAPGEAAGAPQPRIIWVSRPRPHHSPPTHSASRHSGCVLLICCAALRCITVLCSALCMHHSALHCTTALCTAPQRSALHHSALHCTTALCTALRAPVCSACAALACPALHPSAPASHSRAITV